MNMSVVAYSSGQAHPAYMLHLTFRTQQINIKYDFLCCLVFNGLLMWKYCSLPQNEPLWTINVTIWSKTSGSCSGNIESTQVCHTVLSPYYQFIEMSQKARKKKQLLSVYSLINNRRLSHWPYVLCFYWKQSWTEQLEPSYLIFWKRVGLMLGSTNSDGIHFA